MKKTSQNLIQKLITIFYSLGIAVHLLVIGKVIPYIWVNGGASATYEVQLQQSVVSIVIVVIFFAFTRRLAITRISPKKWQFVALYIITMFWLLGLIMQIVGTNFERYVMSIILLLGVVSHILLIRKLARVRRSN